MTLIFLRSLLHCPLSQIVLLPVEMNVIKCNSLELKIRFKKKSSDHIVAYVASV